MTVTSKKNDWVKFQPEGDHPYYFKFKIEGTGLEVRVKNVKDKTVREKYEGLDLGGQVINEKQLKIADNCEQLLRALEKAGSIAKGYLPILKKGGGKKAEIDSEGGGIAFIGEVSNGNEEAQNGAPAQVGGNNGAGDDAAVESSGSSDDEGLASDPGDPLFHLKHSTRIRAAATTIKCGVGGRDRIKGGRLIQLVDAACRQLFTLSGEATFKQPGNKTIVDGGWKDFLDTVSLWKSTHTPEGERVLVAGDLIYVASESESDDQSDNQKVQFIEKVEVGKSTFCMESGRLCVAQGEIVLNGNDVTDWGGQSGVKTDLSYNQLVKAVNNAKAVIGGSDSNLAELQRQALQGAMPEATNAHVKKFVHFLNALMFGVEPSGLNAGFIEALMTLDMIEKGEINYLRALETNRTDDYNGIYPYAIDAGRTVAGKRVNYNKEGYKKRNKITQERLESMKNYRKQSSPLDDDNKTSLEGLSEDFRSPIAVKEAVLIRGWLHVSGVSSGVSAVADVERAINRAICTLVGRYLSTEMRDRLRAELGV